METAIQQGFYLKPMLALDDLLPGFESVSESTSTPYDAIEYRRIFEGDTPVLWSESRLISVEMAVRLTDSPQDAVLEVIWLESMGAESMRDFMANTLAMGFGFDPDEGSYRASRLEPLSLGESATGYSITIGEHPFESDIAMILFARGRVIAEIIAVGTTVTEEDALKIAYAVDERVKVYSDRTSTPIPSTPTPIPTPANPLPPTPTPDLLETARRQGFDLEAMLDLDDSLPVLGDASESVSTPDGFIEYRRSFETDAFPVRWNESSLLVLELAVELTGSPQEAADEVRYAVMVEMDLESFWEDLAEAFGVEPTETSFSANHLELSALGENASGFILTFGEPPFEYDFAALMFARGRVTGEVAVVGIPLTEEDVLKIVYAIDEQIQRYSP